MAVAGGLVFRRLEKLEWHTRKRMDAVLSLSQFASEQTAEGNAMQEPSTSEPPGRSRAPLPVLEASSSSQGAQPSAQLKSEVIKRMSNAELGAALGDTKSPTAEVSAIGKHMFGCFLRFH